MKSLFYTNRITASSYYIRAQKHSSLSARFETSSRSLNYLGRDRFQNLRENGSLSPILRMHYTGLFNPLLCPHKLKQHERRSRRKTRVVIRALAHPFVRAQQSVRICAFCAFAAHSYTRVVPRCFLLYLASLCSKCVCSKKCDISSLKSSFQNTQALRCCSIQGRDRVYRDSRNIHKRHMFLHL